MFQIIVTVAFLLAPGFDQTTVRSAPLFSDSYASHAACAKRLNGLGIGAKAKVAAIVAGKRPRGSLVASMKIACEPG